LNAETARTARTSTNVGKVIAAVEGQPEGSTRIDTITTEVVAVGYWLKISFIACH